MSELGGAGSGQDSGRKQGNAKDETQRATDVPSTGTDQATQTATIEKPTEPLTRTEYREQIRRGPAAGADDPAGGVDSNVDTEATRVRPADRGKLAEPLTRNEYRDKIRQEPAAGTSNTDSSTSLDEGERHTADGVGAIEKPGAEHEKQGRADQGQQDREQRDGKITHFHSEFKGETLDLYTDGTRWATAGHPRREDTVTVKPDVPDRPPTGAELVEGAGEEASLAERLRRELYEESDDELDVLEKGTNLAHDVFSREPTGSYESTPANHPYISEAQPSVIDPGSMATSLFTLGLVIDRGLRWGMRHYGERSKRR